MANWDKITSRGNVDDRRSSGGGIVGGLGLTGTIVVAGVILLLGGDVQDVQNTLTQVNQRQNTSQNTEPLNDGYKEFSEKIIGSNNEIWKAEFAKNNQVYIEPKLVLFRGQTQSGCGVASSQIGPHYCQLDQTIYLDETFFDELENRFGARGGEVAESYVMAHEVGHHIQKINGTFDRVNTRDNEVSVKVELQADCYAGIWAGNVRNQGLIEQGEIEQAIDAAESVGDDRIQKSTTGRVNPETWTHGSSEQRKEAFLSGFNSLDSNSCNYI